MKDLKKLKESEIMSNVLEALDITANKLSNRLGYKSPASIYHILNDVNKISISLAEKVVELYPQVNYLYLTRGQEPILLERSQNNIKPAVSLYDVPKLLKDIKELLSEVLDELKKPQQQR